MAIALKCFVQDPDYYYEHYDQILEIVRQIIKQGEEHKAKVMRLLFSDPPGYLDGLLGKHAPRKQAPEIIVKKRFRG